MGRAARLKGKTLEERINFAFNRAHAERAAKEAKAELRIQQEIQAVNTMVWWQLDMSIARYEMVERYKHKQRMKTATLMSVLAGTLYSSIGGMYNGPRR